ncbi:hypothetical protein RND81_03G239900 [Saponaria officinalis]|uniref:EF-hand domain-containing protein n=1 Tax=Saponaria officinalis TaxID=3572 RepID=A0AAW1MA40_SAPOF
MGSGSSWGRVRSSLRWVPKFKKSRMSEEELRRVFMEHDKNGDGHLDKDELKQAFRELGARVPAYRADRAIHYSDIDMDGTINIEEELDHLVAYARHYGYALDY